MDKQWTNSESEPLVVSQWKVKYNKQELDWGIMMSVYYAALTGDPPRVKECNSADTTGCFYNSVMQNSSRYNSKIALFKSQM